MGKAEQARSQADVMRVQVAVGDKLIHEGRILSVGEWVDVPADRASGWIADRLARPAIRIRALAEITIRNRTLAVGEEYECDEGTAIAHARGGRVEILNPSWLSGRAAPEVDVEPPPPKPKPVRMATVRALVDNLTIGNRVHQLGDVVETEEGYAVSLVARGVAEGVGLAKMFLDGMARDLKRSGGITNVSGPHQRPE